MLLFSKKANFIKAFASKRLNSKNKLVKNQLVYGILALRIQTSGFISNFQMDSLRFSLRKMLKRDAQFFLRVFTNVPNTKKANAVRLGHRKANVNY